MRRQPSSEPAAKAGAPEEEGSSLSSATTQQDPHVSRKGGAQKVQVHTASKWHSQHLSPSESSSGKYWELDEVSPKLRSPEKSSECLIQFSLVLTTPSSRESLSSRTFRNDGNVYVLLSSMAATGYET